VGKVNPHTGFCLGAAEAGSGPERRVLSPEWEETGGLVNFREWKRANAKAT
jgi:hypothetical protein